MSQEHKKEIALKLKAIMPKTWKYTLSVANRSSIVMTIHSANVDLIKECKNKICENITYLQLNKYYLDDAFSGETLKLLKDALEALNYKNYNNSDVQSDYFDVGHYVDINIGKWNKPFVFIP